jgi:uncharacterized protein DUF2442
MRTSSAKLRESRAQHVAVTEDSLVVDFADGRTVSAPLAWYPRLLNGTPGERANWRLIAGGEGVQWPELDEDLSIEGLVLGRPMAESPESLKRWLEARKRQRRRALRHAAALGLNLRRPATPKARVR